MDYITTGKIYNKGKIAFVKCIKNSNLYDIKIKDKCFLLIILVKGNFAFKIGNKCITASAPSFLCFDETENPTLISQDNAEYISIYFHPKFLNVNMSFEMLRSRNYIDIATTHDMFMLKPFLNKEYVIANPIIRDVVLYIETHYADKLSLADVSKSIGVSHSTITALMKNEFGCTVMEFLMQHRVLIAKKQLAFTEIPIKDIANRTGFKTVQHFTRVFKSHTDKTPAEFRKKAVNKRKSEIRSTKS